MTRAATLHRRAMELADKADLARIRDGDRDASRQYLRQAFDLEYEAAMEFAKRLAEEPTRSVLLRSAASLGYEIDEIEVAEQLVDMAFEGHPPPPIEDELRILQRNLATRRKEIEEAVQEFEDAFRKALLEVEPTRRRLLVTHYGLQPQGPGLPIRYTAESIKTEPLKSAVLDFSDRLEQSLVEIRSRTARPPKALDRMIAMVQPEG